jgi:hypothetical protein
MIDEQYVHKLSFSERAAMKYPAPTALPVGLYTLSWAPGDIVGIDDESVEHLEYGEWVLLDFPTPEGVPSLPDDRVCVDPEGSADLFYDGLTFADVLTFDQWAATGYLAPIDCEAADAEA